MDLNLNQAKALMAVEKLMNDPKSDYYSKDPRRSKPAVARVQLLSRIAWNDEPEPKKASAAVIEGVRAEDAKLRARDEANSQAKDILTRLKAASTSGERDKIEREWITLTAKLR